MATPLKPWERGAKNGTPAKSTSVQPQAPQFNFSSRAPNTASSSSTTINTNTTSVPSTPPRSTGYLSSQPYMPGFGGGLGGYGGGLGGYGGSYGSYGYGYRPFGGGVGGLYGGGYGSVDSPFIRQAEESTRTAFQSVESVVGAFSSISTMLESTYFAVHSCFRAVLGVAQHFTRLRNHIWGIISAVAILHHLRYWLRKLLRLIRWRRRATGDEVWEDTSLEQDHDLWLANSTVPSSESSSRAWPTVLFFAIVVGIPWLLWKLLSSLTAKQDDSSADTWSEGSDQPLVTARALYDFTPQREDELGFTAGDELVLAPRQLQSGWVLAGKDRRSGLIPVNYIQILPSSSSRRPASASGTPPISSSTTTPENRNSPMTRSQQQLQAEETLLND